MNCLLPIGHPKYLCPCAEILTPLRQKPRSANSKCSHLSISLVLEAFVKYSYYGPSSFNASHHDFNCSSFTPAAESSAYQNCLTLSFSSALCSTLLRQNHFSIYKQVCRLSVKICGKRSHGSTLNIQVQENKLSDELIKGIPTVNQQHSFYSH